MKKTVLPIGRPFQSIVLKLSIVRRRDDNGDSDWNNQRRIDDRGKLAGVNNSLHFNTSPVLLTEHLRLYSVILTDLL